MLTWLDIVCKKQFWRLRQVIEVHISITCFGAIYFQAVVNEGLVICKRFGYSTPYL